MTPFVTAIVLNYQHAGDTLRCVRSLAQSDYRRLSLIVVDNGSAPDVVAALEEGLEPTTTLIRSGDNLGYAAGNNLGICRALALGSDLVWLVNPDVVVGPDTLPALVDAADERPAAGIIGSQVLYGGSHPLRIWFNGGLIDWDRGGSPSHRHSGDLYQEGDQGPIVDVDYVTGASMLVRAAVFASIGLLPEDYFLYFEETDFNMQARRAGWEIIVQPASVSWHYKRSTGLLPQPYYIYYFVRNRLNFSRRYSAADPGDIVDDLEPFISGWRAKVTRYAPDWVMVYDRLVEIALQHGLEGRTGRWDGLADITAPARVA
ncbi:MAG: glycosyltransferase family 2 protein [Acidimicrobiia bacterium]|nr:glycosyltransferase family 2 protein [Acidimicrobiia bacterium]